MEGFVCPACKTSLASAELLQAHFQSQCGKVKESEEVERCQRCKSEFGTLIRRPHECTVCAKIVCHKCSPNRWHVSCIPAHRNVNSKTMCRVCLDCEESTKKLHDLILRGQTQEARECFRENCTTTFLNRSSAFADETKGKDKMTPLHLAARSGKVEIMKWLVEEHGCDPKVMSVAEKITPLEIVIEQSNLDAVLYLFAKGARVEVVRPEKSLRKMLIDTMDRVFLLDISTQMRNAKQVATASTPTCNDEEDEKKCPICSNTFGIFRRSHTCCACSRMVCGKCSPHRWHEMCLPADRNVNNKTYVRICSECHETTKQFHQAIVSGDCDQARKLYGENSHKLYLSSRSAFIGDNPKKQMFTPLHGAASSGSVEMLSFIVEENSCFQDIRTKCGGGSTPLETAAACGHFRACMYLYKKGGDLNSIRSVRLVKCLLRAALKRLLMLMMSESELRRIRSRKAEKKKKEEKSQLPKEKKKLPPTIPKGRLRHLMKKKDETETEKKKTKKKVLPPPLPPKKSDEKASKEEEFSQEEEESIPSPLPIATTNKVDCDDDDPFESNHKSMASMFIGEDIEDDDMFFDMFDDLTPDAPAERTSRRLKHHHSSSMPDACMCCGSNQDTFDAPRVDCVDKTLGRLSIIICFACTRSCANCSQKIGRKQCTAFTSTIEDVEDVVGKGPSVWNSISLFCSEECMKKFSEDDGDSDNAVTS